LEVSLNKKNDNSVFNFLLFKMMMFYPIELIIFCIIIIIMVTIVITILIYSSWYDNIINNIYYSSSKIEEIDKIIDTMKKDLILNIDKYSFIEINDIINIIISIYIKNNSKYKNDDPDINNFIENKRKIIINDVKINLLINHKNDLINKIIMEKNLLNTKLTIADLRNIKTNIQEHKKELENLFDLVNEINIIDIKITND